MKDKVKKVIFNELRDLPSNKVLLWPVLQVAFKGATGEYLNNHLDVVQEVADNLEQVGYARFKQLPNGTCRISKGVDFDQWENSMIPKDSSRQLSIGSLSAQNVQVGDGNTMNVKITPDEFVNALSKMQKNPEKAKSVLSQLSDYAKEGLSLGQTIATFIGLMS